MKRNNKYGVSKKSDRTLNGVVYMSKLEMLYKKHLQLLTRAVDKKLRVEKIEEQVPFVINVCGKKICTYKLDFLVTYGDGHAEHVDCKGVKTAVYSIKKKLVEALYFIKIKEVKRGDF